MPTRRRFVGATLAAPLVATLPCAVHAAATIHRLEGAVFVNDRRADAQAAIAPGDAIVVGHDGRLEFSLGEDSYRLGPRSALTLEGGTVLGALRLLTGTLLAVFGERRARLPVHTGFATIGIRGTGVFLAAAPRRLYTCTCYGTTDLVGGGVDDVVTATHHTAHVLAAAADGRLHLTPAAMQDHGDDDLRALEAHHGRVPAFDRG
ncbi:MAG: hypothetical protein H6977_08460 [Gammaproteobacteria bacterium]|nr:hypothetical protein [Gammaproteobacteria bacterium]